MRVFLATLTRWGWEGGRGGWGGSRVEVEVEPIGEPVGTHREEENS